MTLVNAQGQSVNDSAPVQEEAQQEKAQQEEKKAEEQAPDIKVGYVVGLKNTGEFVFEVLGSDPGIVELMGLHEYAKHRIEIALEMNQGWGTPLIVKQQAHLIQQVNTILNMLTQQTKSNLLK